MTKKEKTIEIYKQAVREEIAAIKEINKANTPDERAKAYKIRRKAWHQLATIEKILTNVFDMNDNEISEIYINTID